MFNDTTKNIKSNFLNKIWVGILSLIAIPFLFENLGEVEFGIFSLFSILIVYFTLADLGLSKSVVRFVTLYRETQKLRKVYSTFLYLFLILGLILFFLGLIFGEQLLAFLKINAKFDYDQVYVISLATVFMMMIRSFYIGLIYAYNRFIFYNKVNVISETLRWSSVVIVSFYENAIVNIFIIQLVVISIHTLILLYYSNKLLPMLPIKITIEKSLIKEILSYSSQVSLSDFFARIMAYADKIVVTVVGTISNLSFYYIAFQVASKLYEIPGNILLVYYTKFGINFSSNEIDSLRKDFIDATKITIILISPILLSVAMVSNSLISLWLDEDVAIIITPILQVFFIGVYMGSILLPSINLSNAIGKPEYPLMNNIVSSIILIPLSIVFFKEYGVIGGAFSWSLMQIFPIFFVTRKVCRVIGYDFNKYVVEELLYPFLKIFSIFLLLFWLHEVIFHSEIILLFTANILSMLIIYHSILNDADRLILRKIIKNA